MSVAAFLEGLSPAFRDARTGETHLARNECGALSRAHELHHLPPHWIEETAANGAPVALHLFVVAGYHRADRFLPLGREIELPLDS